MSSPKKSKPTILCIAADLVPDHLGGAEVHTVQVIKHLAPKFNFILITGPDASIQSSLPDTVAVIPVNYPKIPNLYWLAFIIFGYLRTIRQVYSQDIDLIWAKQSFPQGPLAALLKMLWHKPLYITAQNPALLTQELVVKGSAIKPFHQLFARLLEPLIGWSYRQANTVAAVSHYSQQLATQTGASHSIIIPNAIDPSRFTRAVAKKRKTFTIVSTSSLIPRNGLDILVSACSHLSFTNWQLIIAGEGPQLTSLQSLAKRLNLHKHIRFPGKIANSRIPSLLKSCHVFCRPSRREGFGVSFIEAMAARVPVVATPVGGITDFVHHHRTGLLAAVEDPRSVADNINLLHDDISLCKTLTSNAFKLVKAHYTWPQVALQVEHEFDRLLTDQKAR